MQSISDLKHQVVANGHPASVVSVRENRYLISVRLDSFGWSASQIASDQIIPTSSGFVPLLEKGTLPSLQKTFLIALPNGDLPRLSVQWGSHAELIPPKDVRAFRDISKGMDSAGESPDPIPDAIPGSPVTIRKIGSVDGVALGRLRICPLQYYPETGKYRWVKQIDVTLDFESAGAIRNLTNSVPEKLVINPEMVVPRVNRPQLTGATESSRAYPISYHTAVKIRVPSDGVYQISANALRDSTGFSGTIDPATLRLYHRGVEQSMYVHAPGGNDFTGSDHFEIIARFASELRDDPYNNTQMYWLVWGQDPGRRFAPLSANPSAPNPGFVRSFREQIRVDKQNYFDRLGGEATDALSDWQDHWFLSDRLTAGSLTEFQVELPDPDLTPVSPVRVIADLKGLSSDESGQHRASFWLNDRFLGSSPTFQDLESIQFGQSENFPAEYLVNGTNRLRLAVEQVSNPYEEMVLNWFSIEYNRLFVAKDNFLRFAAPDPVEYGQNYEYDIAGFTSPHIRVYRSDGIRLTNLVEEPGDGSEGIHLRFQQKYLQPDLAFYAVSDSGIRHPESMELTASAVGQNSSTANYLIITPKVFLEAAQQWRDYRNGTGWNAKIITLESLYREWNYGYISPVAIKKAITHQYQRYSGDSQLHVLLIGDASPTSGSAYCPMPMYQSYQYGAVESDFYYANIDTTDLLPEVAIGRIPADSSEELTTAFQKIQQYESGENHGFWSNRTLYIAGSDPVFKEQSNEIIMEQTPVSMFPERLFVDFSSEQSRFYGSTPELTDYFNAGLLHVNFMGHGGGAVWADRSLFLTENISSLNNSRFLPFVTSMTCFTGTVSGRSALGKRMLLDSPNGAIGWFGSSGLGWIWNDYLLAYGFPKYIADPDLTLGEIINATKIEYMAKAPDYLFIYLAPTMLYQYNLLGDPGMHLKTPEVDGSLSLTKSNLKTGELLELHSDNPEDATYVQIYNEKDKPLFDSGIQQLDWSAQNRITLDLPDTISGEQGHVSWFTESQTTDRDKRGALSFAVEAPLISGMHTMPAQPRTNQPVWFAATILSDADYDSVAVQTSVTIKNYRLLETEDNLWQATHPLSNLRAGTVVDWNVIIYNSDGTTTASPTAHFQVGSLPDLSFTTVLPSGQEMPVVKAVFHSSQFLEELRPEVALKIISISDTTLTDTTGNLDFSKSQYDTVVVPYFNPGGVTRLKFIIDPDNQLTEESESNNLGTVEFQSDWYAALPDIGLTMDGVNADSIKIPGGRCWIDPNKVILQQAVRISFGEISLDEIPPGVVPVSLGNSIEIENLEGFNESVPVIVEITTVNSDSGLAWYWKSSDDKSWIRYRVFDRISEFKNGGNYLLGRSTDFLGPKMSVAVNETAYLPGMYVDKHPMIHLIAQDSSGIDPRIEKAVIQLDGERFPEGASFASLTIESPTTAHLQLQPELSPGAHDLRCRIRDIHGNWSEDVQLLLIAGDENRLIDYGNFPNPFTISTDFYYELVGEANSLELKIFTVDGRRIRSFSAGNKIGNQQYLQPGFHQLRWDGRDQSGGFISNGVYFYFFKVHLGDKTVTSKGKIAKAR